MLKLWLVIVNFSLKSGDPKGAQMEIHRIAIRETEGNATCLGHLSLAKVQNTCDSPYTALSNVTFLYVMLTWDSSLSLYYV